MDFKKKRILHGAIFFAIMTVMFFAINRFNSLRSTHYVALPFETQIPLVPFFAVFYVSAWLFYLLPFFFSKNEKELKRAMKLFYLVTIINCLIFLIFPVKVADWNHTSEGSIFSWLLNTIKENDLPFNAFPSMHISLSTLSFIFLSYKFRGKRDKILVALWYSLIVFSVLLTKQHNVLDVFGGIGLAILVFYAESYLRNEITG